ncbi:MAG: amino acid adenylation domain-containing protein [Bacteroidota bacterium]
MSSSLLKEWKLKNKGESPEKAISKAPENAVFPLSRSQQRLWFLQQLHPNSSVYNYAEIYTFSGPISKQDLVKGLQAVFQENDILKTKYLLEEGMVVQLVDENSVLEIKEYDFSGYDENTQNQKKEDVFARDTRTAFDLTKAPLVRMSVLKISKSTHILLVTMHHILTDKWSMGLFREQLAKKYSQSIKGEILNEKSDIQYTDYAYWQKENGIRTDMIAYWMEKLSGTIPELDLPVDHPSTIHHTFNGDSHIQHFSEELSKKMLSLAKELEVTPYVFFLSAFYVLLYKYSGQEDILVGSPISNRNEPILQKMIGFFDETIVLRSEISPSMSFREFVREVNKTAMEAFSNKEAPFDLLVKKLSPDRVLGRNPFFRSMFIYHSVPETPSFGNDVELTHSFYDNKVSKFDLTLYVAEENGLLYASFEYATDLFEKRTIERIQEHLKILLEKIVDDPNQHISNLDTTTEWEKDFFFSDNSRQSGPYDGFNGIHDIIFKNSIEHGEAIAVSFGDEGITYHELKNKAEAIARRILKHTKGNKQIVGLCANRSVDMIVGLMAILKAGCAYMPIDPEYPKERIHFMLEDSETKVIVTQEVLKPVFKSYTEKIVVLNEEECQSAEEASNFDFPSVDRNDLAYVIYTSGSTGKPKGVPISHGNIIGSTQGRLEFYDENPSVFLLMSSIAFDSSKAGIFWTLCTGGKLLVSEKHLEQDIDKIGNIIEKQGISHTLMLPSLYGLLLEHVDVSQLRSLKTVIVAGEACLPSIARKHFETLSEANLYNEYGPTEGTVWCIAHKVQMEDVTSNIPIGKAVADSQVFLLDKNLKPVPYGASGEIYLGGPGLALKYLNNPSLTKEAYIESPFEENAMLYRTGDLGKFDKHGNILFLGRADQQVKIRGYRIELDEIERTINESGLLKRGVVTVENSNLEVGLDDLLMDPQKLSLYLENNLGEDEIEELLNSIANLKEDEKEFLLNQIK